MRLLRELRKRLVALLYDSSELKEIDVRGRNLAEGVPAGSFTLNSDEILEALQEPLTAVVHAVKRC